MRQNSEQHEAIHHKDGPMMVLAGPGAGKTFVIASRVKYLIEKCGVEPEKILVVTFSKAAASEMRERFERMTEHRQLRVRFGTFHSVFFQILRVAYHYEAKDIDCYYSASCPEQVFRDIYRGYQKRLQRHRALDFDDMVVYTHKLLSARPDILSRWQKQFQYILIDEFQDINRLQYEAIRMLAKPEDNIFIVGDDDQSIYGFRGARPDIMLSFPKEFPEAKKVTLGVNYRCSSQVLKASGRLIRHNKKRFDKQLSADAGKIEGVHICRCQDLSAEAERIIRQIQEYAKGGIPYEEMAVIYRTNMQMRTLAGKLMERGIPFTMKENMPNMFDSWLAKDLLCYVELALGDRSREKFLKIANRPVRYLSRAAFNKPEVSFDDLRLYYRRKNQMWMLTRVDDFENELRALCTMSPYSALHYIRKGIGYDEFIESYAKERNGNAEDWLERLTEIQETARDCVSLPEWLAYVESYGKKLEEIRKEQDCDSKAGVSLMTMHGSKGLEFEAVFIPTVNEGVCPYRKAVQSGAIEEERRMLYVAMTRAKKHLHLSFVKERFHKEIGLPRSITEISPEIK